MFKDLTNHPNWQMSTKYFYKKYAYRIQMGPFKQRFNIVSGMADYKNIDYRQRWDWVHNFAWQSGENDAKFNFAVYTSSEELVNYLLDNFKDKILCVNSPINEKHSKILDGLEANTIFRKQLYYKQYPLKMEVWRSWRNSDATDDDLEEAYEWILENFNDRSHSRITLRGNLTHVSTNIWNITWSGSKVPPSRFGRYVQLPIVYTTDEPSLMMFKLMYGNKLNMEITRVVTL